MLDYSKLAKKRTLGWPKPTLNGNKRPNPSSTKLHSLKPHGDRLI